MTRTQSSGDLGTRIARYDNPAAHPARAKRALGAADDVTDADGKMVLDWKQAQEAAREWFKTAFFRPPGSGFAPESTRSPMRWRTIWTIGTATA